MGHPGLRRLLAAPSSSRQVYHRVLVTPQSLPADALVVDQVVVVSQSTAQTVNDENSSAQDQTSSTRSLLVLKRRDGGMVCSLTEEEGHKRVSRNDT